MNKIKLIHYTAPVPGSFLINDRFYHVRLGNGYRQQFTNEKNAKAFLSQTSRDLTVKMIELNFLYAEVLQVHRNAWPYFDLRISESIFDIERAFDLMHLRCEWENGNEFTFSHLYTVIASLKSICADLLQSFMKRNSTNAMYQAQSLITRLEYIDTYIAIYPDKIQLAKERQQETRLLKVI